MQVRPDTPQQVLVFGRQCLHIWHVNTRRELGGLRAVFMCPECGVERLVSVDWATYPLPRNCACGTRLNRYNAIGTCGACRQRQAGG